MANTTTIKRRNFLSMVTVGPLAIAAAMASKQYFLLNGVLRPALPQSEIVTSAASPFISVVQQSMDFGQTWTEVATKIPDEEYRRGWCASTNYKAMWGRKPPYYRVVIKPNKAWVDDTDLDEMLA